MKLSDNILYCKIKISNQCGASTIVLFNITNLCSPGTHSKQNCTIRHKISMSEKINVYKDFA